MFLNDNKYFYVYLLWGKKPNGTYMSHACKSIPKNIFNFFFHFKCLLLQISHKKCFFVNVFILGRSGVKQTTGFLFSLLRCTEKTTPIVNIHSMCYEKYDHVQWLLGLS